LFSFSWRITQPSGLPSMLKGDIFGMFIGRLCFSLMEKTTMMMVCLQARKKAMMENGESISSRGRENIMQRSKLRRDSALRFL
jgi:hypothetical protein